MRILIAEDERITRATLVRHLEGWGHSVTATENGDRRRRPKRKLKTVTEDGNRRR